MEASARWRWLAIAVVAAAVVTTMVAAVEDRVAAPALPVDAGATTEAADSPPFLPHSELLSSLERAARKGGGGSRSSRSSNNHPGRRRSGRSTQRPPPLPWSRDASMHLGMSLAPFCDTTLTHAQLARSILSMRSTGVRHVSINVFGMQASETATKITVGASADCVVTPRMVRWLVRRVHAAGMAVFLKPHVNLTNGRWRGEIRPSAAWFAAYRGFILDWAKVAAEERVATFSIGVEKKLTLGHVEEWLRILRGVRARYKGSVTYCANWDSYMAVSPRMWKELDFIGINAYFPLKTNDTPTDDGRPPPPRVTQLRTSWDTHIAAIESWRSHSGLPAAPIIFTEAGYKSIAGAPQRPYAWRNTEGVPVDLAVQRDAYDALLSVMSRRSWFKGIYWWTWEGRGAAADGDRGYSPQHKPAEGVVRYYYHTALRVPLHIRLASFEKGEAGWRAVPLPTPAWKVAAAKRAARAAAAAKRRAEEKAAAKKRRAAAKKRRAAAKKRRAAAEKRRAAAKKRRAAAKAADRKRAAARAAAKRRATAKAAAARRAAAARKAAAMRKTGVPATAAARTSPRAAAGKRKAVKAAATKRTAAKAAVARPGKTKAAAARRAAAKKTTGATAVARTSSARFIASTDRLATALRAAKRSPPRQRRRPAPVRRGPRPTDVRATAAGASNVASVGATHGRRALRLIRTGDGRRRWDAAVRLGNAAGAAVVAAAKRAPEGPTAALPLLEMDVTFAPRPTRVWGPARARRGGGGVTPAAWARLSVSFASTGGAVPRWAIPVAMITAARDDDRPVTRHVAVPLRAWRSLRGSPTDITLAVGLDGRWGGADAPLTVYIDNVCVTRMSRIPAPWG